MPFTDWDCAHGDAPPITLPCAATVALAPADDSVDTNNVIVTGSGTITSFGPGPVAELLDADNNVVGTQSWQVTKQVTFEPTSSASPIVVQVSSTLRLLGGATRTIAVKSISIFYGDSTGWTEQSFVDTTQASGGGGVPPGGLVSADTPNMARLGSDSLVFVPDAVSNGIAHGRLNAAWVGVPVTPLDGGNF